MRLTPLLLAILSIGIIPGQSLRLHYPNPSHNPSPISESTYHDLVRYTKYSSGAYQMVCLRPLGNVLVQSFASVLTGTRGFIARDDHRKEIIIAFRGSKELGNVITDAEVMLVPLESPGIDAGDAHVHWGFQNAYNEVATNVLRVVGAQLRAHPGYTVIAVGHSLGGAVASLCGLSVKVNFPEEEVKIYTFGQPRTGNAPYAALVEQTVGFFNVFRAVHTFDGVPTVISPKFGYSHHGVEYWQFAEPAITANVKMCVDDDDETCSRSVLSTGVNVAHMIYFGQVMTVDPRVCI